MKNENKRNNDNKGKTLNELIELKEKEKELEDCDLLISECMCNKLYDVWLHNFINEESKIT